MATVYIKGSNQAHKATEWIKTNLKNCEFTIELDCANPFGGCYKFDFSSPKDATMVALRWGNNYGRV